MSVTIDGTAGVSTPGLDDSGNASIAGNASVTGAITQGGVAVPRMVLSTAQASTSGTNIDFTGIPSWVKRITVMFNGVSTNGTSNWQIQFGTSGGVETSGYLGATSFISSGTSPINSAHSSGHLVSNSVGAANIYYGAVTCVLINSANNTWVTHSEASRSDATSLYLGAGSKALSSTLDRVRITTVNGTDTFDAGTINIMYEG